VLVFRLRGQQQMIKVTVLYPADAGKKFDHGY
jgi:hypothetical protein